MRLNRREFLRKAGAAAVLNAIPGQSIAQDKAFRHLSAEMTLPMLEKQKVRAVKSLAESIPDLTKADYLRAYVPYLPQESQMYIPDTDELRMVTEKSEGKLDELAKNIQIGSYGIYAYADVNDQDQRLQRAYVVKRIDSTTIQFIKAYKISMAENGFGNEIDSNQTPLGLHHIQSKTIGRFGEVVSQLKKARDIPKLFTRIPLDGKDHWFVHSFGRENGNEVAEVVTDEYLITGPQTSALRGIRLHGTNRSGEITDKRTWNSFLDGNLLSGACIRFSNVDIRDLGLSGYIDVKTPIMIHASPKARTAPTKRAPKEWTPPEETKALPPATRNQPNNDIEKRKPGGNEFREKKLPTEPKEWIPPR